MLTISEFQETVWAYYSKNRRELPWREPDRDGNFDPYKILVSEIMLQQTQATRVIPKYEQFMGLFPTIDVLARAQLSEVLIAWSGLGYNRRAKFLWQTARQVQATPAQVLPNTREGLQSLPGIGSNTAGAILAYAHNSPVVYIETNIRTVFIYHFFPDSIAVDDKQLLPLIEEAVDREHPREWYWALMDYGVHIKATHGNSSRYSKHHSVQSRFEGSRRQLRGKLLRMLAEGPIDQSLLASQVADERFDSVITDLIAESLVQKSQEKLSL